MNFQKRSIFVMRDIVLLLFLAFITNNIHGQSWSNRGPGGGGWITAMTVVNDPLHTVYVGCDVGGIYKSTDNGNSWVVKNEGLSIYFMHDIEYDRNNTETLYLASRGGVYKTIDGGDHWIAKRTGFPAIEDFSFSAPVSDIVIDPNNSDIVFAGIGVPDSGYDLESYHWQSVETKGSIYKSTNGADSWTLIHNTGINTEAMIYSLAIDPSDSEIMYAATSFGIYKSFDAGDNWVPKSVNLPHGLTMRIIVNPESTNILYSTLWASPGVGDWEGGVYKSVDSGDSWDAINTGLPAITGEVSGLTTNYINMSINEQDPETLYVGNIPWTPDPGVYKTINGGNSWTWVSRSESPNQNLELGWIEDASIGPMAMALDQQDTSRLYFATSMHLFTTEDAAESWDYVYTTDMGNGYWKGNGFETTVVQTVAVDPSNSNNVYAGYWDIGFLKSLDGGSSFKRSYTGMTYIENTFDIIVDPDNSAIIYATGGWWDTNLGEVYKSTNYGESWVPLNNGIPDAQIWSIALDENSDQDNRILYAASYDHGVYKSINGGQSWTAVNTGLGLAGNLQVKKVVIDPNDSQVLYAGIESKLTEVGNNLSTIQGGIYKSDNAGGSWMRIDLDMSQINVWDIEIDPNNSNIIYSSVKGQYDHSLEEDFLGGVYKSTNAGGSWVLLNNGFGNPDNLNITDVAIDPSNSNVLYATTADSPFHDESAGRGIFKSIDGGASWQDINDGLGVLYYETITIDPSNPTTIYAGSSGNGLMKWSGVTTELHLKAFLQGPFDSIANVMKDGLRENGHIPLVEPYTALGFVQVMSGGETVNPAVLTVTGSNAIVDWVLIELRDAIDPSVISATRPALLQRDGDVVGLDGVSPVNFDVSLNDFYVTIRHRNHFGVRSLNSYSINETITIDFTVPETLVFGANSMENINGNMVLISGDANSDGQVNPLDKNDFWRPQNGNDYIYIESKADFNLDGVINAVDVNSYWRVNNSKTENLY